MSAANQVQPHDQTPTTVTEPVGTTPTTPQLPVPDAVKQFLSSFSLALQLPGEGIIIVAFNAWITGRETMSQPNRDAWDALMLKPATRFAAAMDKVADLMGLPK